MAGSGMILIREVADAPVIMGISKPAELKSPCGEVNVIRHIFRNIKAGSTDYNNSISRVQLKGQKKSAFPTISCRLTHE